MSNFRDALFNGGKNATCQVINSPTFGASAGVGLGAEAGAILLGPQIGFIYCDRPDITEPPAPPFTGGQCPGVNYTVVFRRRTFSGGSWGWSNNFSRSGTGPVGVRPGNAPSSCSGQNGDQPNSWILTFNGVDSPPSPLVNACVDQSPGYEILSVTRGGGLPDNCGDPPPIIPPFPPGGVTNNYDITYEDNEGNTVNLSVPITVFKPFLDFSGNFSVPLAFNVGGVTFNGTIKPFGDPEFTLNFPTTGGQGTTDGTEQPNPVDPTDTFEPADEESPSTIIGVEVFSEVTSQRAATSIIFANAPNIFAPRLGSVSFCIRTPSALVWTADIDIKNKETYIPCPAPQGAVAVRATANPGVTVRWNPIRSRPLLQIS